MKLSSDYVHATSLHFHTRASELFVVLAGRLQVLLGEEVHVLEKDDVLLVPPHVPHAFGAAP